MDKLLLKIRLISTFQNLERIMSSVQSTYRFLSSHQYYMYVAAAAWYYASLNTLSANSSTAAFG